MWSGTRPPHPGSRPQTHQGPREEKARYLSRFSLQIPAEMPSQAPLTSTFLLSSREVWLPTNALFHSGMSTWLHLQWPKGLYCIFLKARKQPALKEDFQASILRERESAGKMAVLPTSGL